MKRTIPIHPFVFAAFPPVFLYVLNMGMVSIEELWRPLIVTLVLGAVLFAGFGLLLKDAARGAIIASGLLGIFFAYESIDKRLGTTAALAIQVIAAIALLAVVWKIGKRDLGAFTKIANFFSIVLIALSLFRFFNKGSSIPEHPFLAKPVQTVATQTSVKSKPDIYFVILDGYGRADQLERLMEYDNSAFIGDLTKRGFYIAAKSHSTYCQTQLSLASTLNLSHVQDFPKTFPTDGTDRAALTIGMDKSFVASYLRSLGYRYLGVTTGFDGVKFDSADLVYSEPVRFTMLESALLAHTPLPTISPQVGSMFNQRRRLLLSAFDNLKQLGKKTASPRFVVAHILAPHPPFVFDHNGEPTRYKQVFGYWDGSHYMEAQGTPDMYRRGYAEQIQYINKLLLGTIDEITRRDPDAVIVLQGDHGSKLHLDQDNLDKTDVKECFSNLYAVRGPKAVKEALYPEITSVNTFRLLFNGLFGEKIPLLPDRSYYSPFSHPYRFTDVTSRLQQ